MNVKWQSVDADGTEWLFACAGLDKQTLIELLTADDLIVFSEMQVWIAGAKVLSFCACQCLVFGTHPSCECRLG